MEEFVSDLKIKGSKSASLWGIQPKQVSYLIDVAASALGREFFANQKTNYNQLLEVEEPAHPLLRLLKKGEFFEPGISELLEAGLYCEAFMRDPNLSFCLNNLRQEKQYESTLFQLGMAFRLKIMGYEVRLEPETLRGKSDIEFSYDGKKYIAECYRLNKTLLDYKGKGEEYLATKLVSLVGDLGKPYSVVLRFKENIEEKKAVTLFKPIKEKILAFNKGSEQKIKIESASIHIELEDISKYARDPDISYNDANKTIDFLRNKDFDELMVAKWVSKEEIFRKDTKGKIQKDQSRVFVYRLSDESKMKSAYDVLESKISTKIKQTKISDPLYGRVLFVLFPYGLIASDHFTHDEIRLNAVRNFENLSGIFLFDRQIDGKNRFRYDGAALAGSSASTLPNAFFSALKLFEKTNLFLNAPKV